MHGKPAEPPEPTSRTPDDDVSQALRETVSALMDGEPATAPLRHQAWTRVTRDAQARQAWLEYHQVGDCLRSSEWSGGFDDQAFLERFQQRLRAEPVQLAPAGLRASGGRLRSAFAPGAGRFGAALAACALLLVGGALPHDAAPWPARPPQAQRAAGDALTLASATAAARAKAGTVSSQGLRAAVKTASHAAMSADAGRRALLAELACLRPLHGRAPSRLHAAAR